jgi:hypothetical protein
MNNIVMVNSIFTPNRIGRNGRTTTALWFCTQSRSIMPQNI